MKDEEHLLLLLSDSALPIGSFAFSSGLESFLQHFSSDTFGSSIGLLTYFLRDSLRSVAYTTLPFIKAVHLEPSTAVFLDDHFDATVTCPVARRASLAQGKALLTIWEKAFLEDKTIGYDYRFSVKGGTGGHFGIAWGVVCAYCNISLGIFTHFDCTKIDRCMYVFLLNHAKAVVSAAVRLSLVGPYQAQGLLADSSIRQLLRNILNEVKDLEWEDAGQTWALIDVYQGRQEILYSRVFNG
jgi:urease accessory protein